MLRTVSLFFLVSSTVAELAEYTARCGSNKYTTFTKTEDDVEGRYTVEWCEQLPENVTRWILDLKYTVDNRACQENLTYLRRRRFSTKIHSPVRLDITKRPQCNITCLSLPLDMVFSSCYLISNDYFDDHTHEPNITFHRIDNKFDSFDAINELQPISVIQQDGSFINASQENGKLTIHIKKLIPQKVYFCELAKLFVDATGDQKVSASALPFSAPELVVTYNLHYIHVNVFGMKSKEYKQNATVKEVDEAEWVDIVNNCTNDAVQVICHVTTPPEGHCVRFSMEFRAWWRNSFKNRHDLIQCTQPSEEVEIDPGMDVRVWWAVGALALTLSLLVVCWAAHTRVLADVRKKVLQVWVHRYAEYTAEHTAAPAADPGHILLLYARDCEPAMEAIGLLKEMLEEGAPGRVYDIFSASCMAQYAEAPEEWLCDLLSRSDVRVVLVQTPAAATLYAAQVSPDNLQMQQPLLGARVHYKKPHFGDVLLQLALRLVRDMAPTQQEYARYYIATISELEKELMPQVSPYRRYELPAHTTRLLADLRLPADQPQRLRSLAAAIHQLQTYVGDNENYLKDELMFI